MKKKTALLIIILLVIFLFLIKGMTFSRAESAVFPTCTNTSLDKYIFQKGCVTR